jgi:hypothetical protein
VLPKVDLNEQNKEPMSALLKPLIPTDFLSASNVTTAEEIIT